MAKSPGASGRGQLPPAQPCVLPVGLAGNTDWAHRQPSYPTPRGWAAREQLWVTTPHWALVPAPPQPSSNPRLSGRED